MKAKLHNSTAPPVLPITRAAAIRWYCDLWRTVRHGAVRDAAEQAWHAANCWHAACRESGDNDALRESALRALRNLDTALSAFAFV